MKRRSFFGALAALIAAPTVLKKLAPEPELMPINQNIAKPSAPLYYLEPVYCPPDRSLVDKAYVDGIVGVPDELRGKTAKEVLEMCCIPVNPNLS